MQVNKTITCEMTCFRVQPAVHGGVVEPREWFAVATAHVFDMRPPSGTRVPMTPDGVVLSGAAMRVLEGRGSGESELLAMSAALKGLLGQVEAFRARVAETEGGGRTNG